MASGVMDRRNEPNWSQPRPKFRSNFVTNPNPNSAKTQIHSNGRHFNVGHLDESSGTSQPRTDYIQFENDNGFNRSSYECFNVSSYSRKEVINLKNRLIDDLERIRYLTDRIENGEFDQGTNKEVSGLKRSSLPNLGRESKRATSFPRYAALMNTCGQVLAKLMRHKHGWIFNVPVDVVGMGLHDYYQIIKNPMDLGSVKVKLGMNIYQAPVEFAADVRLTFNNAMMYNPKGHDVYIMAEQFLTWFEDLFRPIYKKFQEHHPVEVFDELNEDVQVSCPPLKERVKKVNSHHIEKSWSNSNHPPSEQSPVPIPSSPLQEPPNKPLLNKMNSNMKLPKPKAKDPRKRDMSLEEKQMLGFGLQDLSQEKLGQVVHILKKRNGHLFNKGDEVELDIDALDAETLWELDRFLSNWNKFASKMNKQPSIDGIADDLMDERSYVSSIEKRQNKGDLGEEDVDIGDDIPTGVYPSIEIEKDESVDDIQVERDVQPVSSSLSGSSGSSSDSSLSSDSDSGSDSDNGGQVIEVKE